jgi:hypothetical protein
MNRRVLYAWHPVMVLFLVLALVAALRRWPWYVRLLFTAGWLFAGIMVAIERYS